MRISLRDKSPAEIEFGIIYGSIAVIALVAARYLPITDMLPDCAFKAFTGIPCPTCGTTRSLMHLAHGDLRGSLLMNPVFALVMVLALLWFLYNSIVLLFNASRLSLSLTSTESNFVRFITLSAMLLNWSYLGLSQ